MIIKTEIIMVTMIKAEIYVKIIQSYYLFKLIGINDNDKYR